MRGSLRRFCVLATALLPLSAWAGTAIPFTINLSKAVNVVTSGGTPRIAVDVGGTTRYANYTSGSGTSALVFTYQMISGDVDADGVTLSSPVQLNGGTIKDLSGNPLSNLTFTPPNTSGIKVNGAVPSGYSVAFTSTTVTNANKTGLAFTITSPKLNRTFNYSISSSGGGTPITGTGSLTASPQTISGINATSLPDGVLTLSLTLTDSLGGVGVAATSTIPMAVLNANLVGHWTFDASDISGTTAYDRSGNGNNGTLTNGPTSTAGRIGGALSFDGVNDFVGATPTIGTTASFSYWATRNATFGRMPFALGTGNPGPDVFFDTCGKATWNTYDGCNNPFGNVPASSSDGSYHHYAFIISSASTAFYYDGALVGTATYRNPTHTILQIGGHVGYQWLGKIDDFRVYNTALTPAQITTLYNAH